MLHGVFWEYGWQGFEVSRSYLLHNNEQYKTLFIAPDRTKFEQEKHKRLIAELRRSECKENLIIRNGQITVRSVSKCIPSKD